MLTNVNSLLSKVTVKCDFCQTETDHLYSGLLSSLLAEFGEYENVQFTCPNCGAFEVFNMNIPATEEEESSIFSQLSTDEQTQRTNVRALMHLIRADLIS